MQRCLHNTWCCSVCQPYRPVYLLCTVQIFSHCPSEMKKFEQFVKMVISCARMRCGFQYGIHTGWLVRKNMNAENTGFSLTNNPFISTPRIEKTCSVCHQLLDLSGSSRWVVWRSSLQSFCSLHSSLWYCP